MELYGIIWKYFHNYVKKVKAGDLRDYWQFIASPVHFRYKPNKFAKFIDKKELETIYIAGLEGI